MIVPPRVFFPSSDPQRATITGSPNPAACLVCVHGPHLNGEFVFPRVTVADQLLCSGVEVLFSDLHALSERSGRRLVEYLHAAPRSRGHFDAVEAGTGFWCSRARGPNLSRWERIAFNCFVTV